MATQLPDSMCAIEIKAPGGPEMLVPALRPLPKPGKGEILVRVAAAGVNRPDVLQRQGGYPPPKGASDIPGLEIAGTVVGVGEGATRWEEGDEICALVAGGGYAEYCTVPEPQALPIPAGLDLARAAALPETFFTVWTNLFERGRLAQGETFLVHGGSSGIGTTAIQLAKAFGARVFATAGNKMKCQACEKLGAERAINYREEDFAAVIQEATGGRGVDVILDMVGGDYIQKNIALLAMEGRLVNIAYLKGSKVEVNFLPVMLKRLTITGSTLRPRSVEEKGAIARALEQKVWPLIGQGRIQPVIEGRFPLTRAADAHRLMETSAHIGKIVLVV
ncbi:MAG TPA: NAD(P)H-quinone oxidoreductase [Methylomirabilota bacterium]|jgi:putative PIG3 family NAD(P)H quinone oxidoreductase|nr:NAD(P)H-quinone oxidoreductase [Methylomirabilota bacterium]